MSVWNPTHVQFTVLRARNLISKGKAGNNDVFVTIQLGKEKFQTSTIKNALKPEWFEECDLPIPHMHTEIEVCLYHRGVLSDDFLGYVAIPLWEHKITEGPKSEWVPLHNKPNAKSGDSKYRGELEVKLTFHCQSKPEMATAQLKKRSSSIRNIATAFGDKFKFHRSKSFRDNRRDSENVPKPEYVGGTRDSMDPRRGFHHSMSLPAPPVHFSALDLNQGPWGLDPEASDGQLTRSYSLSAAYVKSMSLDRTGNTVYSQPNGTHNMTSAISNGSNPFLYRRDNGVLPFHCQSLYNLPGNRRSCADLPFHPHAPPPPYDIKQTSQDDSALHMPRNRRAQSESHISSAFRIPVSRANNGTDKTSRREKSSVYESIKERTEPENSGSSTSDLESVPGPKPRRANVAGRGPVPVMGSKNYGKDSNKSLFVPLSLDSQLSNHMPLRDSGIIDDRSSSQGNSQEGGITTPEGFINGPHNNSGSIEKQRLPLSTPLSHNHSQLPNLQALFNSSDRGRKKINVPSVYYTKENSQGELVVRKRSRGQRDRLRQLRQTNRRYTVQGLDGHPTHDESMSEPSDSSNKEVTEDLMQVFKNMTKEELQRSVIQMKAQMIRKDQYIKDLENYIDDLLVRVMESTPRILSHHL